MRILPACLRAAEPKRQPKEQQPQQPRPESSTSSKNMIDERVVRVLPFVQRYAWGCSADTSLVASVARRTTACVNYSKEQQEHEDTAPFAELWIGTHPNGCSNVVSVQCESVLSLTATPSAAPEPVSLREHMIRQQQHGAENLPFLLKILSVATPLSLQSHPDRALAVRLHAERPLEFKDANHKPEMAIALGSFAALAGFRPAAATATLLVQTPELQQALGAAFMDSADGKAFVSLAQQQTQQQTQPEEAARLLKAAFAALLLADKQQGQQHHINDRKQQQQRALKELHQRLMKSPPPAPSEEQQQRELHQQLQEQQQLQQEAEWVALQLLEAYPTDVGCFAAFFLNLVLLKDGEALFVPPNYMHCYLKGHCVELMAASDNVIRGGLTSKQMDAALLLESLDFSPSMQAPIRAVPTPLPEGQNEQLQLLQRLCVPQAAQQQQKQQQQQQCCLYYPPLHRFPEFCTARICLPQGCKRTLALLHRSPGVLLVLWSPFPAAMQVASSVSGSSTKKMGVQLATGDIFFVASGSTVTLDGTQAGTAEALAVSTCSIKDTLCELQHQQQRSDCLLVFLVTGGLQQ